jgi:DNA polymerase III subunit alpha
MIKASAPFYHLHVHTEYSLQDSVIRIDPLLAKCKDYGMDAVAITDLGNMFGVAAFYTEALRNNIKPVIGCEVYVAPRSIRHNTLMDHKGLRHLVLIAKNREGYTNLCKLVSIAHLEGFYYKPRIDKELLAAHSSGLIGLSACFKGEIPSAISQNDMVGADTAAKFYMQTFGEGNFFLEIQENGMHIQHKINKGIVDISERLAIPMVATNDCHYLNKDDRKIYEIMMCIQPVGTMDRQNGGEYDFDHLSFKSPEEMIDTLGHFPGAIENTREVVNSCNVEFDSAPARAMPGNKLTSNSNELLRSNTWHFPEFVKDKEITDAEMFRKQAMTGFEAKLARIKKRSPHINEKAYRERIAYEIKTILDMCFPTYFLMVADFIAHARNTGVPVGPGRGSSPGSMVAYALGITALDPIEHGLFFECFLNPSKPSLPDIVVDFCSESRENIYDYVVTRYGGPEYVCLNIVFVRLKVKSVIKDVGKALGMTLSEVETIDELIPHGTGNLVQTMEKILDLREKFQESEQAKQMLKTLIALEGMPWRTSTHAAGFLISDKPLNYYLPQCRGNEGEALTQFEINDLTKLGLVTFDILGIPMLTIIKDCLGRIKYQGESPPDLLNLDLCDARTFEMIGQADTHGVFNLESTGMKDLILRMKPVTFSDIMALMVLCKPGFLDSGMTDTYIKRKNGREKMACLFDELQTILSETCGLILYQEQIMKIANQIAGLSLPEADDLRKAVCEGKVAEIADHRDIFILRATKNSYDPEKTETLFDWMVKFGKYGSKKSHVAAYALISYQAAYLKAHFPDEFLLALKSSGRSEEDL